jgi:hypothetical protein
LRGRDRRSIGNVDAVVAAVQKKPDLFKDLAGGLFDEDPVVRMRTADAMVKLSSDLALKKGSASDRVIRAAEKLTRTGSPAIQSHGKKLIEKLKKNT